LAKFVDAKERHVFVLAGDRIAQSGCIPEFPTDGLADSAAGHALAFDTTNPGRWDTGLVELLGMRSAATTSGLAFDATAVSRVRPQAVESPPGRVGQNRTTTLASLPATALAWRQDYRYAVRVGRR
jgi:hypothetical protein